MTSAGTVTPLFTDLVGSTEIINQIGDDAAERLRRTHFRLLREAAAANGGHEGKSLGDGLMVVFNSALYAVGEEFTERFERGEYHEGPEDSQVIDLYFLMISKPNLAD